MVYPQSFSDCSGVNCIMYTYLRYLNSNSVSQTIAQGTIAYAQDPPSCQGNIVQAPRISADSNGNLHVVYGERMITSCNGGTSGIKYINNVSGAWSAPPAILSSANYSDMDIAADKDGTWHVVYTESFSDCSGVNCIMYTYLRYLNSNSVSQTIAQGTIAYAQDPPSCQGNIVQAPRISADSNGNLHVVYGEQMITSCNGGTSGIKYINNVSGAWSAPPAILSSANYSDMDIAADKDGTRHVVYTESFSDCSGVNCIMYTYLRYLNSNSVSQTIAQGTIAYAQDPPSCQGNIVQSPGISADSNGDLHVVYGERMITSCNGGTSAIKYISKKAPPKLFVAIPGIDDTGLKMLERAAKMVRHDLECRVIVREVSGLSVEQVRQLVTDAAMKAKSKGKDVVVLIDMDLENYTWEFPLPPFINRWDRSVRWAGEMANIVSDAFTREVPSGVRILYAHSAGGDATCQSIERAKQIMYDNINILNGRTSADELSRALKKDGYGWQQIKVFTSEGDLPATPSAPKYLKLWSGSISNYDAAREWAGKRWVHLHSLTITGHNGLRDSIGIEGTFEVNLGPFGRCDNVAATVEEMMLWDWQAGCPPK